MVCFEFCFVKQCSVFTGYTLVKHAEQNLISLQEEEKTQREFLLIL